MARNIVNPWKRTLIYTLMDIGKWAGCGPSGFGPRSLKAGIGMVFAGGRLA
ncbi:MAG: hypothetical protein GW808_09030 [Sphingomonadales bacterium]|nr:hypothetical protein [Sphingomonadales bacterium]NCO49377.1 hypothetical protein [Sphingomonadales bacterium]NCP00098.1 hypothetical protein [Sphingomonadales bacterium]NCP43727.1 hypothetical protein [Sphingomonadales bacterium]NCQ09325.1 hypothetical protein [Sphingomonadales bacterium]